MHVRQWYLSVGVCSVALGFTGSRLAAYSRRSPDSDLVLACKSPVAIILRARMVCSDFSLARACLIAIIPRVYMYRPYSDHL